MMRGISLTILLLLSLCLFSINSIKNVNALGTFQETLLCNGFTNSTNEWYKVGSTPQLRYVDYPYKYIWAYFHEHTDAWYTFDDMNSAAKSFVKIEVRAYCKPDYDAYRFWYSWSNGSYSTPWINFWYTANNTWQWTSWSEIVYVPYYGSANDWQDVNDTKIALYVDFSGTDYYIYVDCIQIRVTYTSLQWNNVETWYGTLYAPTWWHVESWYGTLGTLAWHHVEFWYGQIGSVLAPFFDVPFYILIFGLGAWICVPFCAVFAIKTKSPKLFITALIFFGIGLALFMYLSAGGGM